MSQREELWMQVESLAKNNPEWPKMCGQMDNLSISSSQNEFEENENCDLTYDKLEQESRQPQIQQQTAQDTREVSQILVVVKKYLRKIRGIEIKFPHTVLKNILRVHSCIDNVYSLLSIVY